MKREIVLFLGILLSISTIIFFIFTSNLALAREITLGKYKYPSIILIPIISIIVCSIILIVILLNIAKKRMITKKMPLFVFGRHAKEKRHENIYLKDIKKFKKELNVVQAEQAFNMLSDITKNFFKELIDLHYEFTYDELEKELRKRNKRKELIDICHELSELKYSGRRITKQELEALAGRIEELIRKEQVRKEEKELGVSKALMKERKGFLSKLSGLQTEQDRKKHLLELMKQEEDALKKDMEIAKNIYHKILASYYKLPAKERKDVYEKLTNFYEQINKMLFSSFYSKQSKKQLEYFTKQLSELQKEAEKVIAAEKFRGIRERAAEKFKAPALKVPVRKAFEIKKEKVLKTEELKKLERVEKEAMERIKNIGEGIVEQGMMQKPMAREKPIIREIKYVMPHEHVATAVHEPVHKPSAKPEVHIPLREAKHAEHVPEHVVKHIAHVEKSRYAGEKEKHVEKEKAGIKSRKFMHIAKEEKEIMEKLERLRKSYIG